MTLSKTKVLLLNVNREGWHSGNMIYDMEAIKRACDTKMYGPGWPDYRSTDLKEIISQLYGSDKPDVIYSYFTPNERVRSVYQEQYEIPDNLMNFPHNLDKIDTIKIFALSDFWARKAHQYTEALTNSTFQYCFCCFAPPYSNPKHFFAFFDKKLQKQMKFVGYPRCVDKDCFKDYGLPKEYDIITLGAMWRFYPLRVQIHQYLQKHYAELGIRYHNYPHCGVDFKHSSFVRDNYAKAINQSKMLASCGSRFNLLMNKTFEAMGCNTLYIGSKPYGEKELHLRDGWNYVAVNQFDFVEKIQHLLKNDLERQVIIRNAQATFQKYHHIDARAQDFVKLINQIGVK